MKRLAQILAFITILALISSCGPDSSGTPPASPAAPSLPPAPVGTPTPRPRTIVIDTDMASDDWMAILYLLQRTDVTIKAITVTGTGEAHCAPGIQHAVGLMTLAGYDKVPVACGRETPLQGNHAYPNSWRDAVDNLFGLTLPTGQNTASNETAVDLLKSVIGSSPDKVTLLTLGPLTNVAEAFQNDPSLVNNIEMIYVMGGAVNTAGNVKSSGSGIDNQVAEWNIYVDPYAANVVLKSGAPVTLVSLDATNQLPLTADFYARLQSNHKTPEATFVYDLYTKNHWLIDSGTIYFWDQFAAAVLSDESLATFQNANICVTETEGKDSGGMKSGTGCPEVRFTVSADGSRFQQLFLDTLNGVSP